MRAASMGSLGSVDKEGQRPEAQYVEQVLSLYHTIPFSQDADKSTKLQSQMQLGN